MRLTFAPSISPSSQVDTHVHASSCMNQKHLLRFIKSKIKNHPDDVVIVRNGENLTLAGVGYYIPFLSVILHTPTPTPPPLPPYTHTSQLFKKLNLRAYDLTVDILDMHAVSHTCDITCRSMMISLSSCRIETLSTVLINSTPNTIQLVRGC